MSMRYGRAIRIVRTAYGLTQAELADRLTIKASHLSLVESGKRQPSLKALGEISVALGVPMHLLTLLASDAADLKQRANAEQVATAANALLDLLISVGDQPLLPMKKIP